jgi:hypothetical protein
MAQEVKYDRNHHAGGTPEARTANRLKNSGDEKNADVHVVHGTGPTRTHTNVHLSGSAKQHGPDAKGEGDIHGNPRGSANTKGEI